jgi:hypothetical protein
MSEYGAAVEWYWRWKTEGLVEKPVLVPLCPPQIPRGLTWKQTRDSALGNQRLAAWAMAQSYLCRNEIYNVYLKYFSKLWNILRNRETNSCSYCSVMWPPLGSPGPWWGGGGIILKWILQTWVNDIWIELKWFRKGFYTVLLLSGCWTFGFHTREFLDLDQAPNAEGRPRTIVSVDVSVCSPAVVSPHWLVV